MLRGLYTAASGMISDLTRLDVISNNLANASSAGFKREEVVQHSFQDLLLRRLNDRPAVESAAYPGAPKVGVLGTGAYVDSIVTDYSSGSMRRTDNPLDLSLRDRPAEPTQFFAVETPAGIRYTRTLQLQVVDGQLLTQDGYAAVGQNGPVRFTGSEVYVDETGQVLVDGRIADKLQVITFPQVSGLQRQGASLYRATGLSGQAQAVTEPRLLAGYEESSNVNPVIEMVRLIEVMRSYEAGQKAVQSQDGSLEKLLQMQA